MIDGWRASGPPCLPWLDYRQQRAREHREAAEREEALRRAADDDYDAVSVAGEEGAW